MVACQRGTPGCLPQLLAAPLLIRSVTPWCQGEEVPTERLVWGCALLCITKVFCVLENQAERVPAGLDPMGVCRRQRQIPEERLEQRKALGNGWQKNSKGCTEVGCQAGLVAWKGVCEGTAGKMHEGKGF